MTRQGLRKFIRWLIAKELLIRPLTIDYELADDYIEETPEAITVTPCCTELNPDFKVGEEVVLTNRTIVVIETFCEDGMIEINDNYEYYKVDKDELTKRV